MLSCIETHANRYKRHIVPLLCVHMDFYVRLFVRVYTSANEVKKSASKQSIVYQCTGVTHIVGLLCPYSRSLLTLGCGATMNAHKV